MNVSFLWAEVTVFFSLINEAFHCSQMSQFSILKFNACKKCLRFNWLTQHISIIYLALFYTTINIVNMNSLLNHEASVNFQCTKWKCISRNKSNKTQTINLFLLYICLTVIKVFFLCISNKIISVTSKLYLKCTFAYLL